MSRRRAHTLIVGAVVALLATAGIAVNMLLLRYAESDGPEGKLVPTAIVTSQAPSSTPPTTAGGGDDDTRREEPDD